MLGVLALAAFAVTYVLLRVLLAQFARFALDQPNERSLHERPLPRIGGIAVLAGAATSLAFGATALWLPLGLALVLALVSFADDLRSLPTAGRLARTRALSVPRPIPNHRRSGVAANSSGVTCGPLDVSTAR